MQINESRTAVKLTPGRAGRRIEAIVGHHWGGDGQAHDNVVDFFCNPAKQPRDPLQGTSAHFVVSGGRVHCIVSPTDTAWHAGDWETNLRTIGIEMRPEATDADYRTAAELVRWLRARHGNLPIYPHKKYSPTLCPGRWDLARLDREARGGATVTPPQTGAMRIVPEMYPITQAYRQNATAFNQGAFHGAIDYGVPVNTPIVAPEDGVVVFDGWAWDLPGGPNDWASRWFLIKPARGDTRMGGGILTIIRNASGSHWGIAHANRSIYNAGDRVRKGQIVQLSGNTGSSTGPHSHLNLWPANPSWGNGAFGAIDPQPYIRERYAPLTAVSWQGAPTAGVGATTTEKETPLVVTKEDEQKIEAIMARVLKRDLEDASFKDTNGNKRKFGEVFRFRVGRIEDKAWSAERKLDAIVSAVGVLLDQQTSGLELDPDKAYAEIGRATVAALRGTTTENGA